jgi:hypothetical protein
MKLTQNIGFANNQALGTGEYDFNFEHPLIWGPVVLDTGSSPAHSPFLGRQLADLVDDYADPDHVGDLVDSYWFRHYPMNMAFPEVSELLAASIKERVTVYDDKLIDFNSIGGEFYLQLPTQVKIKDLGIDPAHLAKCTGSSGVCMAQVKTHYLACLSVTDYSAPSLRNFRYWLQFRRDEPYDTIDDLKEAWNTNSTFTCTGSVVDCTMINPAFAPDFIDWETAPEYGGLQVVLNDWLAFQEEQFRDAQFYQYTIAKAFNPQVPAYNLVHSERGTLDSDGFSSNFWYGPEVLADEDRTSFLKLAALRGASYGESVNFPLFVMPSEPAMPGCEIDDHEADWPTDFRSKCYDTDQAIRTLNEMLTVGVDSVGFAYFENGFNLNLSNQQFGSPPVPFLEAMISRTEEQLEERLFMTPWRSPLLVHVDADKLQDASTKTVLDTLSEQQVQFAPFTLPEAVETLDDLWLTSARKVLLLPFVKLDQAKLHKYQQWALDHEWDLVVMTDLTTAGTLGIDPSEDVCDFSNFNNVYPWFVDVDITYDDLNCESGEPRHRLCIFGGAPTPVPSVVRAALEEIIPWIESETDGVASRPVRAYPTTDPTPPEELEAFEDIDLTVSCDGINYLVAATNVGTSSRDVRLRVETLYDSGTGFGPDAAAYQMVTLPTLAAGESVLQYIPRDFPDDDLIDDLDAAVTAAVADVAALDPDFDTRAAKSLLKLFPLLDSMEHPEKVLAGLLRLERMTFLEFSATGTTGSIEARTLHADSAVPGMGAVVRAKTQAEFALHRHARRAYQTSTTGFLTSIDLLPPTDAKTWDFGAATQDYEPLPEFVVNDVAAAQNVVKIQVLNKVFLTVGGTVVVDP